jgi:aquaporin NIP
MKKYYAEVIGTFALVFCGTGAIVINEETAGVISHAGVAFTFGLIVTVMIYALGPISGAHLNPAVTIGFTVAKRFPPKEILPYIFSQAVGALLASLLLRFLFVNNERLGATLPSGTALQSFVLETVLTFLLMLVIMQVATGSKEQGMFAGLAIGSTVLLEAMFAGPICGASMNPIRSFSPAIVSGHLDHLWIYLTAPVLGATLAIFVWNLLKSDESNDEQV